MRINGVNRMHDVYRSQNVVSAKKANSVASKDEVKLSNTAKDFGSILKMLSDVPNVRQDKVDALKEQIKSGNYNVRCEEVAEKIMSKLDIKG